MIKQDNVVFEVLKAGSLAKKGMLKEIKTKPQ